MLVAEWRHLHLPLAHSTIVIAVSGGADSTALLLAIDELNRRGKLGLKVVVAHLDHGLRNSSRQDARWVRDLARQHEMEVVVGRAKVNDLVKGRKSGNIEQTARKVRYEFLERTAKRKGAWFVLTAHTMDDQAETVLLRLMRGSAGSGLSAMNKSRPISKNSTVQLVRPLLWARRVDTESYCEARQVCPLQDEMNQDQSFARVRVRSQLLPLMQTFNGRIVETLARTAELLRDDSSILASNADELMRRAELQGNGAANPNRPDLNVRILAEAPPSLRRLAIRQWLSRARGDTRRLEMTHIVAVDRLLDGTAGGRMVELPGAGQVVRNRGVLRFREEND